MLSQPPVVRENIRTSRHRLGTLQRDRVYPSSAAAQARRPEEPRLQETSREGSLTFLSCCCSEKELGLLQSKTG